MKEMKDKQMKEEEYRNSKHELEFLTRDKATATTKLGKLNSSVSTAFIFLWRRWMRPVVHEKFWAI